KLKLGVGTGVDDRARYARCAAREHQLLPLERPVGPVEGKLKEAVGLIGDEERIGVVRSPVIVIEEQELFRIGRIRCEGAIVSSLQSGERRQGLAGCRGQAGANLPYIRAASPSQVVGGGVKLAASNADRGSGRSGRPNLNSAGGAQLRDIFNAAIGVVSGIKA